jgi:hypothetical protein
MKDKWYSVAFSVETKYVVLVRAKSQKQAIQAVKDQDYVNADCLSDGTEPALARKVHVVGQPVLS